MAPLTVGGDQEHAGGVDVEAADREEPRGQLVLVLLLPPLAPVVEEVEDEFVLVPRACTRASRLIAAEVPFRFVEQKVEVAGFSQRFHAPLDNFAVDGDYVARRGHRVLGHGDGHAVDLHAPGEDEVLGRAPGRHAELRERLGEPLSLVLPPFLERPGVERVFAVEALLDRPRALALLRRGRVRRLGIR